MQFFEVHPDLPGTLETSVCGTRRIECHFRPGFAIKLGPTPGVCMGPDGPNEHTVLPIGHSIAKFLLHHDDAQEDFYLLHGKLEDTRSGLCLVAQTEEEAQRDELALVLIDVCADATNGVTTRVVDAYGCSSPTSITYTHRDGNYRVLYKFHPGDGLFVVTTWAATAEAPTRQVRFKLRWTGQHLEEESCYRGKRLRRSSRSVRKEARAPRQPLQEMMAAQ